MLSNYNLGDSVASGYSHYSLDSNIIPIATVSRYHKFLTSVRHRCKDGSNEILEIVCLVGEDSRLLPEATRARLLVLESRRGMAHYFVNLVNHVC